MFYNSRIKAEPELAAIASINLDPENSWKTQIYSMMAEQQRGIIWCNRMLIKFPEEKIAIRRFRRESILKITSWCQWYDRELQIRSNSIK